MSRLDFRNSPFSDVVGLLCFTVSFKSFPILLFFPWFLQLKKCKNSSSKLPTTKQNKQKKQHREWSLLAKGSKSVKSGLIQNEISSIDHKAFSVRFASLVFRPYGPYNEKILGKHANRPRRARFCKSLHVAW